MVPETSSTPQQPPPPNLPRDSGRSGHSKSSGSAAGSDGANDVPVASSVGTFEHRYSASTGESSAAGSLVQLDANVPAQFSPFNEFFLDPFEGSEFVHHSELNFAIQRTGCSPSRTNLFSDNSATPSDVSDSFQIPGIPDDTVANFNNDTYQFFPLAHMNNTQSLSEVYLAQWHSVVVPLLPPVFHDMTTDMPEFTPLKNAVLAITAAYVSHLESLVVRKAHRSRKSCYIPQKEHQYQSLQYYNKGIQGIGKSFEVTQTNPLHVLTALLLSYYFELDSGSFTGGIGHMTVIDKFLAANHEKIKTNATGQKLLCTWMNLRSQFVNRYLGGYKSSEPVHIIDTFPLNRMIENGGSHHDSIMIMMCDCKLLSRKITLDWCVVRGNYRDPDNKTPLDHILTQMSLARSRQESVSQLKSIDESYRDFLSKQRARLDKWHSGLDLSELPIDSYVSLPRQSTAELDILPLKFHSFETAMNYSYYAHAQMLCSEYVIDGLESQTFVEPAFSRKDCPWAELILRITRGLEIEDCIYKSTFTSGILSILTACMVVCPRADVASWIQDWIRKIEAQGIPLESGLPFGIIKRMICFILDQRQNRRHVLLILPLDIEDAEKSDLYQSDFKIQVIVCGKNMDTGKLYNEMAEIPEI